MSSLSPLIFNGQQVKARYQEGINGDLHHDDPAGAIKINSEYPIEQFKLCFSNGSEDDGMSNSQAIKINKFTFREVVGKISGQVKDRKNNEVLPGFTIYLLDLETGLPVYNKDGSLMTAITDLEGKYAFDVLPMGKYKVIEVAKSGFDSDNDIDGVDDYTIFVELDLNQPESHGNDFYETPQTPLPVQLMDMQVTHLKDALYQVAWKVAVETNNEKYIVELADDGYTYEIVGTVDAYNQHHVSYRYDFKHRSNTPAFYVKLSQVDFDGKRTELGIRKISSVVEQSITLFPNPVHEQFTISWANPGYTQYEIRNPEGKVLLSGFIPEDVLSWQISTVELPESLYYVVLSGQQNTQTIPVIKQ